MPRKHASITTTRSAQYGDTLITATFSRKGKAKDVVISQASEGTPQQTPIARLIDHTLLKADATQEQVLKLCREAVEYNFYSVCVNSYWVPQCAIAVDGSPVKVAAVVGFPLGAMSTRAKVAETKDAIQNGASEIDMVINIGALKSGDLKAVAGDIRKVIRAAHKLGAIVKVIIETSLLSGEEKVTACLLAENAEADFVKTSTGFSTSGANEADVHLMREVVGPLMGVKASGGVRSFADAAKMVAAGATRIGTSSGIKIVEEETAALG